MWIRSLDNTEEWLQSIPAEVRPHKNQPFYHLLAENESTYVAYVSEQNLLHPTKRASPAATPHQRNVLGQVDGAYQLKSTG